MDSVGSSNWVETPTYRITFNLYRVQMKKPILFIEFWPILSLKNSFHSADKMVLSLKGPLHCAQHTEGIYQKQLALQRIGFSRCVCVCVCLYVYVRVHVQIYMHVYIYMSVCMHVK